MPKSTRTLMLNSQGALVKDLHTSLLKLGHKIPDHELNGQIYGEDTRNLVIILQQKYRLSTTGILDPSTHTALKGEVVAKGGEESHHIAGRIVLQNGSPASKLKLRLYSIGFKNTPTLLKETITDDQGDYAEYYNPQGKIVNLRVDAVDADGKQVELSQVKYGAEADEILNLVAPATIQPLAPEFDRLIQALNPHISELSQLATAREDAKRNDLTFLNRATGWDARLIALAATAVKLKKKTGIPYIALYALFRTGLPTDANHLALVGDNLIEDALRTALKAGIVHLDEEGITAAMTAFASFAEGVRRSARPAGTLSTFGDFLDKSELENDQRRELVNLYFNHQGSPEDFWEKASNLGISDQQIEHLRLQGKLAYLTAGNADLTAALQKDIRSLDNLAALADIGLYTKKSWIDHLQKIADRNKQDVQTMIPPAYQGQPDGDSLGAYAADLARKVALSFPERMVANMVNNDEIKLIPKNTPLANRVQKFLLDAERLGFSLVSNPVNAFINDKKKFPEGVPTDVADGLKMIQRLFQISPSQESFKVMNSLPFNSARDVVAMPYDSFMQRYRSRFPSDYEAEMVYRRAQQIQAVTFNIVTTAAGLASSPATYALSNPQAQAEAQQNLIKQFPTLANLLQHSLDFCDCEKCRSALSPAAYLVDLLHFLEPNDRDWLDSLNHWQSTYEQPYPFKDTAVMETYLQEHPDLTAADIEKKDRKPFDILVGRRPDLQYLLLTCENTNTALPYIDIVNEILGFYVANDGLSANSVFDTGSSTTEELLAEPQHSVDGAYLKLKGASYPLTLPFDLWLESVRNFLDHFDVPLCQVLKVFHQSEELWPDAAHPLTWSQTFAEYLGVSPDESSLFTSDHQTDWYKLYGYDKTASLSASAELKSAKKLANKLGLTYQELIDLVATNFVNPRLNAMIILQKLGVSVVDVLRWGSDGHYEPLSASERTAFNDRLTFVNDQYNAQFSSKDSHHIQDDYYTRQLKKDLDEGNFNTVLYLNSDAECDFDKVKLVYANMQAPSDLDFVKMNLFVRLWKKLGWTMEETDRALQAFMPPDSMSDTSTLGKAFKLALLYIAHLKSLDEQFTIGPDSRIKLLTLWSDLPVTGKNPLYARLFLTNSILKIDKVFDAPLDDYLNKDDDIANHLTGLQAALNLTADEIRVILADTPANTNSTKLSLELVSRLYRHGLLAKALNLSVSDLITFKKLSGIDPFLKPSLVDVDVPDLAKDLPYSNTLAFVEQVNKVRACHLQAEDLSYLLRHHLDEPAGKYRLDGNALFNLFKSLGEGLEQIQSDNAVPKQPLKFTDDILRQKLALVFKPEVVAKFFAFWNGTKNYTSTIDVSPDKKLNPDDFAVKPNILLTYDIHISVEYNASANPKTQSLTFKGVMTAGIKTAVQSLYQNVPNHETLNTLLDKIRQQSSDDLSAFFETYLKKSSYGDLSLGFLSQTDFEAILDPGQPTAPITDAAEFDAKRTEFDAKRRGIMATAFLPFVSNVLSRQLIVQSLATNFNASPSLIEMLVTNASLLSVPREGIAGAAKPLLDDFSASADRGASASFTPAPNGSPEEERIFDKVDTTRAAQQGMLQATLEGYFEVAASGSYAFTINFSPAGTGGIPANVQAGFSLDPFPGVLLSLNDAGPATSDAITLKQGVQYGFKLDATNLGGGNIALSIQGEGLPLENLADLATFPKTSFKRFERSWVLLGKTLQLIKTLQLSERETHYVLGHPLDFDSTDDTRLSQLPSSEADSSQIDAAWALARKLYKAVLRLVGYSRLKADLAHGTDDLIAVLEHGRRPAALDPTQQEKEDAKTDFFQRLADLTRRDLATIRGLAEYFSYDAVKTGDELRVCAKDKNLSEERGIQRLWDALQVMWKLGVTRESIVRWMNIVAPTDQTDPLDIATDLKDTVKARYPTAWPIIARPIFDRLRQHQRDALVAYIMWKKHFDLPENLFEYFLIDPGMEPVVQISRIALAISSVQTFIQRSLLNLESLVNPSAINAQYWEWMKHYRIWEANRQIFLYPENWLEPEFRDDKSYLFKELENALLQGDTTSDVVENAFYHYLQELEEIARLEIITSCYEGDVSAPDSIVLHVIGRTHNIPHKYFYRRLANDVWTAWEPMDAQIEGDHLAAIVWRNRLHVFWVTFLDKQVQQSPTNLKDPKAPAHRVQAHLHWVEYFQGQWLPEKSSELLEPTKEVLLEDFKASKVFVYASIESKDGTETVCIYLYINSAHDTTQQFFSISDGQEPLKTDTNHFVFQLSGKNSQPNTDTNAVQPPSVPFYFDPIDPHRTYFWALEVPQVIDPPQGGLPLILLPPKDGSVDHGYTMQFPNNQSTYQQPQAAAQANSFFYQDPDQTFFVQPSLAEVPVIDYEGVAGAIAGNVLGGQTGVASKPDKVQPAAGPRFPLPDDPIDTRSKLKLSIDQDPITRMDTPVKFGDSLIGPQGKANGPLAQSIKDTFLAIRNPIDFTNNKEGAHDA